LRRRTAPGACGHASLYVVFDAWHSQLTPFLPVTNTNTNTNTNSTYFLGREADAQPLGQGRRLVEMVIPEDGLLPFFDDAKAAPAPAPAPAVS
jgi:hypothetical protein